MEYTAEEIVSSDIVGSPFSSIVDSLLTAVVDGNDGQGGLAWVRQRVGYSNRLGPRAEVLCSARPNGRMAGRARRRVRGDIVRSARKMGAVIR